MVDSKDDNNRASPNEIKEQSVLELPTDNELAATGIEDYLVFLSQLPPTLESKMKGMHNAHISLMFTGVSPELLYGDVEEHNEKISTADYQLLEKVINLTNNYHAVRLNDTQISFLNLNAAARVVVNNRQHFKGAPSKQNGIKQWLRDNSNNWRKNPVQYGLLSGFSEPASTKFPRYARMRAKLIEKLSDDDKSFIYSYPINNRPGVALSESEAKLRTIIEKNHWLSEEDISLLESVFSVESRTLGYYGFEKGDQDWADRLDAIYEEIMKKIVANSVIRH